MFIAKGVSTADWITAIASALSGVIAVAAIVIARRERKSADRAADAAERSADAAEQALELERARDSYVPAPTVGPSSVGPGGERRRYPAQPPPPAG